VVLTPLDLSFQLGADAAVCNVRSSIARLLQGQPEETLEAARVVLTEFFKDQEGSDGVSLPGACGSCRRKSNTWSPQKVDAAGIARR
jgi:hypothetical protein